MVSQKIYKVGWEDSGYWTIYMHIQRMYDKQTIQPEWLWDHCRTEKKKHKGQQNFLFFCLSSCLPEVKWFVFKGNSSDTVLELKVISEKYFVIIMLHFSLSLYLKCEQKRNCKNLDIIVNVFPLDFEKSDQPCFIDLTVYNMKQKKQNK